MAWGEWKCVHGPLPRDKVLWLPQYARKAQQRQALVSLAAVGPTSPGDSEKFADDADLKSYGDTMILADGGEFNGPQDDGAVGHWRRYGGAITLGELFMEFGEWFTAQELCVWYFHAEKLVKKRAHPHGSQGVRDAAQLRMQRFGHYGHRRNVH